MGKMNWSLLLGVVLLLSGCDEDTITKDPTALGGENEAAEATLPGAPGEGNDAEGENTESSSVDEDAEIADADDSEDEEEEKTYVEESYDDPTQQETGAPEGYATLTFGVDDSANKTYAGGQMRWTGSFIHDETSNTLEFAASWLPEDGPFPILYDDGPRSEGGHEQEGAIAGDSIFSTEVYVKADEEVTFEYGLLNEFNNWIWIGPNGTVTVPEGSTDIINLPKQVVPAFGTVDCKLTLDTNNINEGFATDKNGNPVIFEKIYVKGTLNSWAPVRMFDNGEGLDEKEGDGIYTYHHGDSLDVHDGLLSPGSEVQFVFMLGLDEFGLVEDAIEYKAMGDALPDGVQAYTDADEPGVWEEVEVILAQDSKGNTLNTGFLVPGEIAPEPECTEDGDCEEGFICQTEVCVEDTPEPECTTASDCDEGETCVDESCVPEEIQPEPECEADTDCGDNQVCAEGVCEEKEVEEPPVDCETDDVCEAGFVCLEGVCTEEAAPVSEPLISLLNPGSGSKAGGTLISVTGADFQEGATVTFGTLEATEVTWVSDTTITCVTPAQDPATVSVTVTNPDGGTNTYFNSFEYTNEDPPPTVPTLKGPVPAAVAPGGGTSVSLQGWVLETVETLLLDGEETGFELKNGYPVFTAPAGALGDTMSLAVVLEDGTQLDSPVPLQIGRVATPQLDGIQSPDEWPYLMGSNSIPTGWGEGLNELTAVYASFDETSLYIALEGTVQGTNGNTLMVYIDRDYGSATGITDCTQLSDNDGGLDDALSGILSFADAQFGADLAAGTMEMNSVDEGESDVLAGWRLFDNPGDLGWAVAGTVIANPEEGWVEMAIPYSALFADGKVPDGGVTIGAFALLGNSDGAEYSNQSIPENSGGEEAVTTADEVMTFELLEME